MSPHPLTVLCIASYRKGDAFLHAAKRTGARVLLVTSKSLETSDWPRDAVDDIYFVPDVDKQWNMTEVIKSVSWLARSVKIDRIVALDDFDVEKAAMIREHLRIAGAVEPPTPTAAQPNPLIDEVTFLAVMQNLRPYPQ